jgi:TetR/AcrR family transcriptional regulator, cholesterol catabolism regulator
MTTKADVEQTESPPAVESLPEYQRKRRQRIIEAAVELLADGEYETIQVRDVAERAGTSLGTLYRYFSSKEHLYAAAMLEWASNFALPGQQRSPRRVQSDEERLRRLMARTIRALERQPQMLRAQMILENSNDPNAKATYRQFGVEHVATLRAALSDMSAEDAAAIVETALSVMTIGLHAWARGARNIRDVERSVQRSIDLIFSPPPSS